MIDIYEDIKVVYTYKQPNLLLYFYLIIQGVASPLAGQMFFRATLFSAFGASKRWLGTNPDGTMRELSDADYFKAGFMTGFAAAFFEAPIDFYKSQIQVQIIRSKADPAYKRKYFLNFSFFHFSIQIFFSYYINIL